MLDEDEVILRRALDAVDEEIEIPEGFAAAVVEASAAGVEGPADAPAARVDGAEQEAPSRARRPGRRRVWMVAAAAALLVAGSASAYEGRRREGVFEVAAGEMSPRSLALGDRAVVVAEPGTALRYEVGGWLGSEPDRVMLERGEVFLRVEPGSPFEVQTTRGRVQVTGTCLAVALGERDDNQRGDVMREVIRRGGWFVAGAATAALTVLVYEGSVEVATAEGQGATELAAGEGLTVDEAGRVTRVGRGEEPSDAVTASATRRATEGRAPGQGRRAADPSHADAPALEAEVARLREILEEHYISPDTGEVTRRGIEHSGNTDLTPEEWRTLAERGELRFRLPGSREGQLSDDVADAQGLDPRDRDQADELVHGAHEALEEALAELYLEATNEPAEDLSLQAMMSEIQDKTPPDVASHIRWTLAQERAGLAASPPITPDMLPYERMMRRLVSFEDDLERALTEALGAERAHAIMFGSPSMSAHAFGSTGAPLE